MKANSENRLHEVFFYGLYMDPDILLQKGVEPRNPRIGCVDNYKLRIGNRATLLRSPGSTAYGIVYSLTHSEIQSLYWDAGLHEYAAEVVMVKLGNESIAALCCNLAVPPGAEESHPDYESQLNSAMKKLGVPAHGID